ncbi:MAG: hypothetical protein ACREML_04310, partial [Vulcanimicrobiaceae bacterium]
MSRPLIGYLLAALAAIALVLAWGERFAPLTQTTFGLNLLPHGADAIVHYVAPDSSAARFGIRPGDVVEISKMSLSDRYRLVIGSSPVGTIIGVPIMSGPSRRIVDIGAIRGASIQRDVRLNGAAFLFSATITLAVIALIALRRPSLATAALVWFGAGVLTVGNTIAQFSWLPDPVYGVAAVLITGLLGMLPGLTLLPFIVRFPHEPRT